MLKIERQRCKAILKHTPSNAGGFQ